MSLDTFEQTLLTELRQHVAARTPDRTAARTTPSRRWTLGLTGAGLVTEQPPSRSPSASVSSGPPAAYAIETQPDGDVVVTVHDLSDPAVWNGLSPRRACMPTSPTSPGSPG